MDIVCRTLDVYKQFRWTKFYTIIIYSYFYTPSSLGGEWVLDFDWVVCAKWGSL
jgi:hypothetical protein